MDDLDVKFR